MFIKGISFLTGSCSLWLITTPLDAWVALIISVGACFIFCTLPKIAIKCNDAGASNIQIRSLIDLPLASKLWGKFRLWSTRLLKRLSLLRRIFILFFCGVAWSCLHFLIWLHYSADLLKEPRVILAAGSICSLPFENNQTVRFDFCVHEIDDKPISWPSNRRLKVSWGPYIEPPENNLSAGQHLRLVLKARPVHGLFIPHNFDSERWMIANGYLGTASVKQDLTAPAGSLLQDNIGLSQKSTIQKAPVSSFIAIQTKYHQLRQKFYSHINHLTAKSEQQGLMSALIFGERGQISQAQWTNMQKTGTSHLLAISGLHIGIATLWSYWVVLLLWKQSSKLCLLLPAKTVACWFSLVGAFVILSLSGFGLPAQRAFLMVALVVISFTINANYRMSSLVGMTIIFILLYDPFAVLSASFWLSFIAVITIALAINRQHSSNNRWCAWFKINWYLYVIMIPVSCIVFTQFSGVALLANMILIPFTSFVTAPILYLATLSALIAPNIATLLFSFADLSLTFTQIIQATLAQFNPSMSKLLTTLPIIALLLLFFIVIVLPKKLISQSFTYALLITVLSTQAYQFDRRAQLGTKPQFKMWIFDVGHGLSIYVETKEGNLLFDTGWGDFAQQAAISQALNFFRSRNVTHLDKLILSHADADHAGGISVIADNLTVGEIISGENVSYNRTNATSDFVAYNTLGDQIQQSPAKVTIQSVRNCHHMPAWHWGGVAFEFLSHGADFKHSGNNNSCVLSINVNGNKLLLTGDIEKSAERRLVQNGLSHFSLVVAPHHGSRTSSTYDFVQATVPAHVVFSAAYDNQWQFPSEVVKSRYNKSQAQTWTTFHHGTIIVETQSAVPTNIQNSKLYIRGLRQESSFFWHQFKKFN